VRPTSHHRHLLPVMSGALAGHPIVNSKGEKLGCYAAYH